MNEANPAWENTYGLLQLPETADSWGLTDKACHRDGSWAWK